MWLEIPAAGASGVLFAHGSRFGGHTLYVKDNRLHYVYNFVGMLEQKIAAGEDLPVGENVIVSAAFVKEGDGMPARGICPCITARARSARDRSRPSPRRSGSPAPA